MVDDPRTTLPGRMLAIAKRWYGQFGPLVTAAAALTTLIGAGTASYQLYSSWHDDTVRRATVAASLIEADSHLKDRDYALSWTANARALEAAPTDAGALAQQAHIAMVWLEDVRLSSKPGATKFGDIADPLLDALARRAAAPGISGVGLADIKAHIGWALFLRSRDGVTGLRIADTFDDALRVDPGNMYGHVMKGFFILWQGAPPAAARADFDTAMASPIDPPYHDRMILSAMFNTHDDEHEFAAVDYANRIRKAGRTIDARSRQNLLGFYETGLSDITYLARLAHVAPPEDLAATLNWVLPDQPDAPLRQIVDVLDAYFLETAGKNADAVALYRRVIASSPPRTSSRALDLARSGLRRLTQPAR